MAHTGDQMVDVIMYWSVADEIQRARQEDVDE